MRYFVSVYSIFCTIYKVKILSLNSTHSSSPVTSRVLFPVFRSAVPSVHSNKRHRFASEGVNAAS